MIFYSYVSLPEGKLPIFRANFQQGPGSSWISAKGSEGACHQRASQLGIADGFLMYVSLSIYIYIHIYVHICIYTIIYIYYIYTVLCILSVSNTL